ncbi:serine/threonine-protein phosphatase 7 long form-like protein, partial [Trifolium medium]|nr:serine/threonine-protein phosphatase 7 long form-like protein [Trifolium medium]
EVVADADPDHDGEELCVADFQQDEPNQEGSPQKKLEGTHQSWCIFKDQDPAEFPGGPKDKSVLALYGGHIARYLRQFDTVVADEEWFLSKMVVTGLAVLEKTGYQNLDPCLISAFVERWNEETSSFHM